MNYLLEYGQQHIYLLIFAVLIIIFSAIKERHILSGITLVVTILLLITPFFYPIFKYDNRYDCKYEYAYKGSDNYIVKTSYSFRTDTNDFIKNNLTYESSKKAIDSVFNRIDARTISDDQFKTVIDNIDDYVGYEGNRVMVKDYAGVSVHLSVYSCVVEKVSK